MKARRVEERGPPERQPEPEPAKTNTDEFNTAAKKPIDLKAEFERASGSAGDAGEATGGGEQEPAPEAEITIQRRRRARDGSQENDTPAKRGRTERDPEGDNPSGDEPRPHRRRNRSAPAGDSAAQQLAAMEPQLDDEVPRHQRRACRVRSLIVVPASMRVATVVVVVAVPAVAVMVVAVIVDLLD